MVGRYLHDSRGLDGLAILRLYLPPYREEELCLKILENADFLKLKYLDFSITKCMVKKNVKRQSFRR